MARAPVQRKSQWFAKWQLYKQDLAKKVTLNEIQWEIMAEAWHAGYEANARRSEKHRGIKPSKGIILA